MELGSEGPGLKGKQPHAWDVVSPSSWVRAAHLAPARCMAHAGDPLQGSLPQHREQGAVGCGRWLISYPSINVVAQRSSTAGAPVCWAAQRRGTQSCSIPSDACQMPSLQQRPCNL